MPDISMCSTRSCRDRNLCYRYRAVPSSRQSWANFTPNPDVGRCDSFLELRRGDRLSPEDPASPCNESLT